MLFSIYKYKMESFFNENTLPFNNQFLYYEVDIEKENNQSLCFKEGDEGLQVSSWDYLFNEYISGEYWKYIPDEFVKDKGIPGFVNMDYSGVNLIINNMFFIFDINKNVYSYRKELAKFHYQYQTSHYKGDDDVRIFFIRKLLFEMWVWDLAYDKLTLKKDELIFTAESGVSYNIHELIDRLCDIIRVFSLPEHLLEMLNFINPMLHECIDFILGKNEIYDLNFDDVNLKYIDGNYFSDTYQNKKEAILNALKDCARDSQSPRELFVSHLIIRNYSFFVLKNKPDEILLLKSFLSDNDEVFIKVLSLAIDIGFCVWKDSFDGLDLEKYLDKVEETDFLING
ncbi:hypothetical protein ACR71G_19495 [Xenorhabdus bovienii]|uniref:hypothetical protein n=1 Tax=Xenorhabdus bovienii TaxID=40576 RepID=UPI003DA26BAB